MTYLLAALIIVACCTSAVAQHRISMRELGHPAGSTFTIASALNNQGSVVGSTWLDGSGHSTPFLWSAENGYDLFLSGTPATATDINDRGDIVGILSDGPEQGFGWSKTQGLKRLGDFFPFAINNHGDMAGTCAHTIPCVLRDGELHHLPTPPAGDGSGSAADINDRGVVVGNVFLSGVGYRIATWDAEGMLTVLPPIHLPGAPFAKGINNQGEIAGQIDNESSPSFAAAWDRSRILRWIGPDESFATAINEHGAISGQFVSYDDGAVYAAVMFVDGSRIVLGRGGAVDLNDSWQVLGSVDFGGGPVVWTIAGQHSGVLRVETPNSPTRWGINTRQRLAWTYSGTATQFAIDFSPEPDTWIQIDIVDNQPGNSQNYYRTVTAPPTTTGRLRVRALGEPDAVDVNDADITIAPAAIGIIYPRPGSTRTFGSTERIFYTHNLGARAPVAIDVSGDGGRSWRTVAARAETNGSTTASFYWTVDLTPTTQGRVRVRALDGSGAVGVSAAFAVSGSAPGSVSE